MIGERLKHARNKLGLTLETASEKTGVGISSLSEFENEKREPRMSQLQSLAESYGMSISFFLEEGAIPAECVLWRQRPDSLVAKATEQEFLRLCEMYRNLETWCDERSSFALPTADIKRERFAYSHAEHLAYRFRSDLQMGDHPGSGLMSTLEERCGVKVFHLDFEPTGCAASTWSEVFGPAILLNAKNVRWRRNFDLAHELFHLLTWGTFRTTADPTSETADESEEKLATCFARNLLLPQEAVRLAIGEKATDGSIEYDDMFDIARSFDVSVEALLWQVMFVFDRTEKETKKDIERAKTFAHVYEDREKDSPPVRPARFFALAIKALHLGETSLGRFAEYLGISRKEAQKYLEEEAVEIEKIQVTST